MQAEDAFGSCIELLAAAGVRRERGELGLRRFISARFAFGRSNCFRARLRATRRRFTRRQIRDSATHFETC